MESDGHQNSNWRAAPNEETLLAAVRFGSKEEVEMVLGSESHTTYFCQTTLDKALQLACTDKNLSVTELLLRSGAAAEKCLSLVVENITTSDNSAVSEDMKILQVLLENNDTSLPWNYERYLITAVDTGNYDLVKLLCLHGADPSGECISEILLSMAASKGRWDIIDLLIRFKVEVSQSQSSQALRAALEHGHADCMEILIRHGAKIDATDAIETAFKGNTLETLKLFPKLYNVAFQNVAYVNNLVMRVSVGNDSVCLRFMLQSGMKVIDMVRSDDELLIVAYVNTELLQQLRHNGFCVHDNVEIYNFVLRMIKKEEYDVVKTFLDSDLDINSKYFHRGPGSPPLRAARSAAMTRLLIDKGARVNDLIPLNCCETHTTPLLQALSKDDEVLQVLLEYGADTEMTNVNGHTALMVASQIPNGENKVEMLLKAGAHVNRQSASGKTALCLAAGRTKTFRTVKLLLEYGADVNLQSQHKTALLNAMSRHNFKMAKMILEKGISKRNANTSTKKGVTPLMMAVERDNCQGQARFATFIQTLATAGADVNTTDDQGDTALMIAAECSNYLALQALIEAGAEVNLTVNRLGSPCTTISLLLENDLEDPEALLCLEELLNHGANASLGSKGALQELIAVGASWLIPNMIQNGCVPQEQNGESPLCVALEVNNKNVAQYFWGNKFLTKSDISLENESYIKQIFFPPWRSSICKELWQEITSQPFPLETLCFVEVSNALGPGPDREERVKKTGLPNLIQTKLLFKTEDVSFIVDEEEKEHALDGFRPDTPPSDDEESCRWCCDYSSPCDSSGDDLHFHS